MKTQRSRAQELFTACMEAMEELGGGSIKNFLVVACADDLMALAELSARLAVKYLPAGEPQVLEASRVFQSESEFAAALKERGLPIPFEFTTDERERERQELLAANQALSAKLKAAEREAEDANEQRLRALQERNEIAMTVFSPAPSQKPQ